MWFGLWENIPCILVVGLDLKTKQTKQNKTKQNKPNKTKQNKPNKTKQTWKKLGSNRGPPLKRRTRYHLPIEAVPEMRMRKIRKGKIRDGRNIGGAVPTTSSSFSQLQGIFIDLSAGMIAHPPFLGTLPPPSPFPLPIHPASTLSVSLRFTLLPSAILPCPILSVCLCLPVSPSLLLSTLLPSCILCLSVCLSTCISVCVSVSISLCLSVSVCLSVCLPPFSYPPFPHPLFLCLSVCLPASLSLFLSLALSLSPPPPPLPSQLKIPTLPFTNVNTTTQPLLGIPHQGSCLFSQTHVRTGDGVAKRSKRLISRVKAVVVGSIPLMPSH